MAKMRRKRKQRNSILKPFIIVTSIVLLNFSGITYASWNENIKMGTSISMGSIDPLFCKSNYHLDPIGPNRDNGELIITFEDEYTMKVQGVVDNSYKAFLHYCLLNNGTVPVKFDETIINGDNVDFLTLEKDKEINDKNGHNNSNGGLKLQLNQQSGILLPNESGEKNYSFNETGNPKLHIQADEEGTYDFEIELLFKQFTK